VRGRARRGSERERAWLVCAECFVIYFVVLHCLGVLRSASARMVSVRVISFVVLHCLLSVVSERASAHG